MIFCYCYSKYYWIWFQYSSWLPNMEKNYVSVRTKQIPHTRATIKDSQYIVQVLDEDRPKPKLDSGYLNTMLWLFLKEKLSSKYLGFKSIHNWFAWFTRNQFLIYSFENAYIVNCWKDELIMKCKSNTFLTPKKIIGILILS